MMIPNVLRVLPFNQNQPLKKADDQYRILKNELIMKTSQCAPGCSWEGEWCLQVGMPPQNTVVVTMVCVLVAVQIDHTLTTFVIHFSFPVTCLAHEVADYVKCASYCLIILLLQTTLHWLTISYSGTDFYGVKITMECITGKHFLHQDNVVVQKKFHFTDCFITLVFIRKNHARARAQPICRRQRFNHEWCVDNSEQISYHMTTKC